jgi:AraC-like DNA-binding protein
MKTFRRYFNIENFDPDKTLSVSIHTLGHHIHPLNTRYPDVSHPESHYFNWENGRSLNEYQLLYIGKGAGVFEATGLPSIDIKAGTILLLYPGIWHRYKPKENTGWEEYWIGFSGTYAKYLLEQECFSPQSPIIEIGLNHEVELIFEQMLDIIESKEEAKRKLSSFKLIQLLGLVYTSVLISHKKLGNKERTIEEIKKQINLRWNLRLDFNHLAKEQCVSYSWLRKHFSAITGTSLKQFHLTIQLRNAEQMILGSEKTMTEIAASCGFESIQYFSRIFKEKMGVKPSVLKNNQRV